MEPMPNDVNSSPNMVPFASEAAQSGSAKRTTKGITSELEARVNYYYQNMEFDEESEEIEDVKDVIAFLLERCTDNISQINEVAKSIGLAKNPQTRSKLESDKKFLEEYVNSLLIEVDENDFHSYVLRKAEEYEGEDTFWNRIAKYLNDPSTKEFCINSIKHVQALNTLEEFRTLIKDIHKSSKLEQDIWDAIMKLPTPGINAQTFFFTALDENGIESELELEMTHPFSIWKAHGKFFEKACTPNAQTSFALKASEAGLDAFLDCLMCCRSENFVEDKNLVEIMSLAQNFKVEWLIDDCYRYIVGKMEDFLKMKNKEFQCQKQISLMNMAGDRHKKEIGKMHKKELYYTAKIQIIVEELSTLAKKFKLANVKCFLEFDSEILPDGTVFLKEPLYQMDFLRRADLIHCLSFRNPFISPKLELHMEDFSADDGKILEQILERSETKCRVTLKIDGMIPQNLYQILEDAPHLKHLKILFDCKDNYPDEGLFEMITNNATLSSLNLYIVNYDNETPKDFETFWPLKEADANKFAGDENGNHLQYMHEVNAAKRDLTKMIAANDRIRGGLRVAPMEIKIVQSNMGYDFDFDFDACEEVPVKGLYPSYIIKYSGRDPIQNSHKK